MFRTPPACLLRFFFPCVWWMPLTRSQFCLAQAHSYVPSFVCSITFVQITAIVEEAISKDTPVRASNLLIIYVKRATNRSDYSLVGEGKLSFKFTVLLVSEFTGRESLDRNVLQLLKAIISLFHTLKKKKKKVVKSRLSFGLKCLHSLW